MATIGQELGSRYRLDALLGAGGMATVFRAHDVRLDRPVAVKVLSPNLAADPTLAQRFEQEARFLAAVNNASVVNVFDVGEANGEPFFVMELVDGETLADRIAREGPVPPDEAVPIVSAIAHGLRVLHRDGFVHRDVKPGNILLPRDGGAKLADFGLVRPDRASDLTAPGTAVGTLAYLAPELLRGEAASPASDVYALGVVAYEALTGRLPYPVETLVGLVEGQAQPAPPASASAPWLTDAFDAPLAEALAADRPSVDDFAASLKRAEVAWRSARASQTGATAAAVGTAGHLASANGAVDTTAVTQPNVATSTTWQRIATRTGSPAPWLVAALAAGIGGILLFAFLAGSFSRPPATGAGPSGTTRVTATPRATQPVSSRPTANPAAGVVDAVQQFRVALEGARGGKDGLKGKEANDLERLASDVEQAARGGDGDEARERAGDLVQAVDRVARDVRDADRARLREAAAAVERAASRLSED
jgi:hypothetical protein